MWNLWEKSAPWEACAHKFRRLGSTISQGFQAWFKAGKQGCFQIEASYNYKRSIAQFPSIKFSIKPRVFLVGFPRKICVVELCIYFCSNSTAKFSLYENKLYFRLLILADQNFLDFLQKLNRCSSMEIALTRAWPLHRRRHPLHAQIWSFSRDENTEETVLFLGQILDLHKNQREPFLVLYLFS